jgi:hypothetical protein
MAEHANRSVNRSREVKVRCISVSIVSVFVLIILGNAGDVPDFEDFFINATMRIDYYHTGNATDEIITLDQIYREGDWAGSPHSLLDPIDQGRYRISVTDEKTGNLIYSRGYDSYFAEYQTTSPAKNGIRRAYHESVLIPYPNDTILVAIERRQQDQTLTEIFRDTIDPGSYHIINQTPGCGNLVIPVVHNGDPANHVDLVVLAEGYTMNDSSKFRKDLKKFSDIFFTWEPYKSQAEAFNFTGIFVPSLDAGVDEPRRNRYKRTAVSATFNSLDSERYLLTEDNKAMRDIAGQIPYDLILIMVNTSRYGGGGIFNQYCTFACDGPWSEHVFHHELGHAFGGLADEYYTSDVSYEDFYPAGIEPLEPNITALLDPEHVKWAAYLDPDLPVPTPWGREKFDKLLANYAKIDSLKQQEIETLRKSGADTAAFDSLEEKYARLRATAWKNIDNFFELHPLKGKVGVFEGAGYMSHGFYRPTVNSVMHRFSESEKSFYPVNEAALRRMIEYYTGKL